MNNIEKSVLFHWIKARNLGFYGIRAMEYAQAEATLEYLATGHPVYGYAAEFLGDKADDVRFVLSTLS